jgi:hypothetical protein
MTNSKKDFKYLSRMTYKKGDIIGMRFLLNPPFDPVSFSNITAKDHLINSVYEIPLSALKAIFKQESEVILWPRILPRLFTLYSPSLWHGIFDLTPQDLKELSSDCERKTYDKNDMVEVPDSETDRFYTVLMHGRVVKVLNDLISTQISPEN